MQKIIVNGSNTCVYNVTIEIITRYFELSNISKPYFYVRESGNYSIGHKEVKYHRVDEIVENFDEHYYVSLNDLGKTIISDDELFSEENFFVPDSILRDDVNLVKAVEEIKPDGLKVVEIPDDIKWYIHESDGGFESIEEVHRYWF